MSAAQPAAVVGCPALAVNGRYPQLLPLGVPRETVEGQSGAGRSAVPTAGHHTRVNHSRATGGERGAWLA